VADAGSTELMIWTDNHRQVPAGRVVKRGLEFSGRTWKLWASRDHHYLAFVPDKPLGHGRIALKKQFSYLVSHGYLSRGSTLGQVCFGYEIVSTKGTAQRFKIDRFSVTSSRK
jgi:Glycosyl hydrolase family 12